MIKLKKPGKSRAGGQWGDIFEFFRPASALRAVRGTAKEVNGRLCGPQGWVTRVANLNGIGSVRRTLEDRFTIELARQQKIRVVFDAVERRQRPFHSAQHGALGVEHFYSSCARVSFNARSRDSRSEFRPGKAPAALDRKCRVDRRSGRWPRSLGKTRNSGTSANNPHGSQREHEEIGAVLELPSPMCGVSLGTCMRQ